MNCRQHHRRGVSLIELLVAIAIFAFMTAITIYNYRIAQRRDALRGAAVSLSSHLREVQNQAMTGVAVSESGVPIGGYGIHFDLAGNAGQYLIFGDREKYLTNLGNPADRCTPPTANGRYDRYLLNPNVCPIGQCVCLDGGHLPSEDLIQTVTLPRKVIIYKVVVPPDPEQIVDISFRPPKPIPYVGSDIVGNNDPLPDAVPGLTAYIVLRQSDSGRCRLVSVFGASGQISEQNVTEAIPGIINPGECEV